MLQIFQFIDLDMKRKIQEESCSNTFIKMCIK